MKIKAEIGLSGLIKAKVDFVLEKIKQGTNTGDRSAAIVEGENSIAIVSGRNSKAKGMLGCWLVLTERGEDYAIKEVKAIMVDGVKVKEDTFYGLINGNVVEVITD